MQTNNAGKQHVTAFASRALTPAERNYAVTHLDILAVVWALQNFRDIVFGYPIIVYTDHSPITEIFKGRNFNGRLARWYLTIQAYSQEMKYTKGRQNVLADALSRNVCVGAVAEALPIPNFSMEDLCSAQRENPLWKKVIYALESGDEIQLPELPISFLYLFFSHNGALCRYWAQKPVPIEQLVISEKLVPTVLRLAHDIPISCHPGRDKTLALARKRPTLRIDVELHVARCITCAQHKGVVKEPAPILQYPLPEAPWDVVSKDLLQLPKSHHGSRYLLVCVDRLTRFGVLAPLKDKTAILVAHALVTHLFCPFSTPRAILSDNGAEFRNAVVFEICSQFGIKQTFAAAHHPASNGLVERANRKILEVLRPIVNELDNWGDWLPHVATSLNSSVNDSTGKSPHYILYGVENRLPYDLLTSPQQPVYNTDNYAQQQLHVF